MAFSPEVKHTLNIDGTVYRFTEHPAAKGLPYGQTGRRATVYQLRDAAGEQHAFKVFTQAFRTSQTATNAGHLQAFAALPGLQVCQRTVLIPERHSTLLTQFPDLTYAALMPWISGETWQEIIAGVRPLLPAQSIALAQTFARMLSAMEQKGVAHCDISGPNVLVELSPINTTLVDVEDLFGPGLVRPEKLPGGSPGYAHRTAPAGLWSAEVDRFGGAIVLAEMLGWCDERVRRIAYGEQFFDPVEMQNNSERYQILLTALRERWGASTAEAFAQAWHSHTLIECPSFSGWVESLSVFEAVGQIDWSGPKTMPTAGTDNSSALQEQLARGMVEKAGILLELGQVEKAITELAEAYGLAPKIAGDSYARALMRRGHAAEQSGDIQTARGDYQIAAKAAQSLSLRGELQTILTEFEAKENGTNPTKDSLCLNCGKVIQTDWISCPYCGASLRREGRTTPQRPSASKPESAGAYTAPKASTSSGRLARTVKTPSVSSGIGRLLASLGVLVVAVIMVVTIIEVFRPRMSMALPAPTPTTTSIPEITQTSTRSPTQTPTKAPTSSPTPKFVSGVYDDFSNVAFNGKINSSLWATGGDKECQYTQKDGVLAFSRTETASQAWCDVGLTSDLIPFSQLGQYQARFKISARNIGEGWQTQAIELTTNDVPGGWNTYCGLQSHDAGTYASFFIDVWGRKPSIEFGAWPTTQADIWHTIRLAVDPGMRTFRCYIDGRLIASHTPYNVEALLNTRFRLHFSTWQNGLHGATYMDDVNIQPGADVAVATPAPIPFPIGGATEGRRLYYDNFSDPASTGWTYDPAIRLTQSNGRVSLTTNGGWTAARSGIRLADDMGAVARFQFSLGANFGIFLENGQWDTEDYRRWGFGGSELLANLGGVKSEWVDVAVKGNLQLQPATWYYALITLGGEDEYVIQIWEADRPENRAEMRQKMRTPTKWIERAWQLLLQIETGTLTVDDIWVMKFIRPPTSKP